MPRREAWRTALAFLAFLCAVSSVSADERTHRYKRGEPLRLWVNKVGPYNNPQQTYFYDSLPLCRPEDGSSDDKTTENGKKKNKKNKKPATKWGGLGEVLGGNRLVDSQLELSFLEPVPLEKQRICSQVLDEEAVAKLSRAVRNHFWFELFLDDLPIWGFVGSPPSSSEEEEGEELHVYTHRAFDISYSADRIIQVNLTSENPQPILPGAQLDFTFEVRWSEDETGTPFSKRFEKYLDRDFFNHRIHWWALANAAATVAFLTALVAAILVRALRADLSRYNNNGNGNGIGVGSSSSSSSSPSRLDLDLGGLDGDFDDETGWKVLSGDVFRTPKRLPLLSALVGTGAQLCLLAFLTSAAAAARGSSLFEDRGSVATVAVVLYALTSVVGGFVAGETFTRFSSNGGSSGGGGSLGGRAGSSTTATTSKRAQARTWLLAATLLPLSSLAVGAFVNSVALLYRSSAAVPFRGVAGVSALWLLLSAPLCRLGFAAGRKRWQRRRLGEAAGGGRAGGDPTRTKRVPSPIPSKPWHRSRAFVCLLAGLLPFSSILVETTFVLAALWNYKVPSAPFLWTLVPALGLLLAATACSAIVAVYSLLCAEDHRWHSASFMAGCSPALYLFAYCVRYFFAGTRMTGVFQGCFYFGWSLLLCLSLGTATGAVGFLASAAFVRRIYRSVKCD